MVPGANVEATDSMHTGLVESLKASCWPLLSKLCYHSRTLLNRSFNFKKTTITHCTVPMLKCPSDEAGPSHW